jgi:hypothetical protein
MDVEYEIGRLLGDVVFEGDGEAQADHFDGAARRYPMAERTTFA